MSNFVTAGAVDFKGGSVAPETAQKNFSQEERELSFPTEKELVEKEFNRLFKNFNPVGRTTYQGEELIFFKKLIEKKLSRAEKEKSFSRKELSKNSERGADILDETSKTITSEQKMNEFIRQDKFIHDLKNALLRIENNYYGKCRITGEIIPPERLKLVPHATLSIKGKNEEAKKRR